MKTNRREWSAESIAGAESYEAWARSVVDTPAKRAAYEREAAKMNAWMALVDAWQFGGFTDAEAARRLGISRAKAAIVYDHGYDVCRTTTLRRYLQTLVTSWESDG